MRSVNRQTVACPEILTGPESRQSQYELVEYFMLPKNERRQLRPPINREIPFHETVKDSLLNLFSGKCAFCESPIAGSLEIDIEHFRPLANAQNLSQKKQSSDHYGWFAYEWRNLFPACARCNRTKRSFFPVRGPRANILSAWDDAERDEKTLLLNPCKDKPYKHLEFDWDGNVFGKTEIGKYTIKTVGLNRPDLISARSEHFSTLRRSVSEIYQLSSHPYSERIFSPLEKHLKDDSPFSGCCLILLYQAICGTTKSEGLTPPSFEKFAKRFPQFFKNMDSENWLTLAPNPSRGKADQVIELHPIEQRSRSEASYRHSASAQITRIEIENFKGISKLHLDLPKSTPSSGFAPCTMLIGENATGKSSVLQAVALCLMDDQLRKQLKLKPQQYLPREKQGWKYEGLKEARVTIYFDSTPPAELFIKPTDTEFTPNREYVPTKQIFGFGANRQFGNASRRTLKKDNIHSLFDTTKLLSPPTEWLKGIDNETFFSVARAIREVLALPREDTIIRNDEGQIFVKAHGIETPIENLSDGYRSLFCMIINIMRELISYWGNLENASGVALIDEIEIHMHPRWKMRVVAALRRAMPRMQIIATTHDPLCLRGLETGEVQVLYRDSKEQIQSFDDLPNVKLLRAEQLLTSEYFGLNSTSDPDLDLTIKNLAYDHQKKGLGGTTESFIDQLGEGYLPLITDSPEKQVISAAIRRYMIEREDANPVQLKNAKEDAVKKVLEALRKVGN